MFTEKELQRLLELCSCEVVEKKCKLKLLKEKRTTDMKEALPIVEKELDDASTLWYSVNYELKELRKKESLKAP